MRLHRIMDHPQALVDQAEGLPVSMTASKCGRTADVLHRFPVDKRAFREQFLVHLCRILASVPVADHSTAIYALYDVLFAGIIEPSKGEAVRLRSLVRPSLVECPFAASFMLQQSN